MELISSPWFIAFVIFISIIALTYFVIKFSTRTKKEMLFYEKLRSAGIFPTIRSPPKPDDIKERE